MPANKNDGTVQYGSMVLAIGTITAGNPPTVGSTTNFVADNVTINRPTTTIVRLNESGEPSGQVTFPGEVPTGSATLQIATSSTIVPVHGKGFSVTLFDTDGDGDNDAEVFYIDSINQTFQNTSERKFDITFRKIVATT